MSVEIELYGVLGVDRERNQSFELEDPISVSEAASLAGVPADHVGMAVLDGAVVPLDTRLPLSCKLRLFPPMMGG